jgi:hypothetical protein
MALCDQGGELRSCDFYGPPNLIKINSSIDCSETPHTFI